MHAGELETRQPDVLVAGIAHDFGNLLAVISNYAVLVSRRVDDPMTLELMQKIESAARRGATMTRQLHDLASCDTMARVPMPVNPAVEEVVLRLAGTLDVPHELRADLAPGAFRAFANPQALELVLANLVSNAVDAMPDGGTIVVATQLAAGSGDAPDVEIRVSDVGAGMAPDVVERALEPLFTTKPKGTGTGLGLVIVERAVASLGGEVGIASVLGSGTTVTVRLQGAPSDG